MEANLFHHYTIASPAYGDSITSAFTEMLLSK